jgi:glycosidase
MKWKAIICLLLCILMLAGCAGNHNNNAPDLSGASVDAPQTEKALSEIKKLGQSPDDNYRTWYEIFVYSFCDSNGDGIGDLAGVRSKLDYLQTLGVTGIWMMPIHPSTTYHKYNVSDYYAIDPAYGTMDDFRALMEDCKARNIKVILDLVVNHSGYDHQWFQAAADYLKKLPQGQEPDAAACPYVEYYTFSREPGNGMRELIGTDWYYEAMFSPDMPDLNLDNPALRQEIEKIMRFWLDEGVSGFRLDAAKEFFTGKVSKNLEVLSWLQETATAIDPQAYLVAEVWEGFATITDYYESGITSIFNFAFGDSTGKIISVIRGAGNPATVSTYATALEKADKAYIGNNPDYIDAPFLSNHDVGRIAGFCAKDPQKTKLAGAMNLFMSGSAFIYYGEEIGMTGAGNDPSKRAPMYWNAARDSGTTQPPPECIIPEEYPFGSLEEQKSDDYSVFNYYRQAIAIRNALPAVSHGRTTAEVALNKGCVSAFRKNWEGEECIVLMNISQETALADLTGYEEWSLAAQLCVDEAPVSLHEGTLQLPAYAVAVLIPKK